MTKAARFDIEYEAKKNDPVKPYFKINFSPFPDTCIVNCKIDLKLTIDGQTCDLLWNPALDTTDPNGRWSARSCTVNNVGLGTDRSIKMDNEGLIELQGGGPYSENTFEWKIEGSVVGWSNFMIHGDFRILCSSKTNVIT